MRSCEEKRLAAMRYVMANFTREGWLKPINNSINKKEKKRVRPREFKPGDLVLKKCQPRKMSGAKGHLSKKNKRTLSSLFELALIAHLSYALPFAQDN